MKLAAPRLRRIIGWSLGGLGLLFGVGWGLRSVGVRFVSYEALPASFAPWAMLALGSFRMALLAAPRSTKRNASAALGLVEALFALGWTWLTMESVCGRGHQVASYPAPQGDYSLIVHRSDFGPSGNYFLRIDQQRGPLSRSCYLGCLNTEDQRCFVRAVE